MAKRIVIQLTDRDLEQIEAIQEDRGIRALTEVIRYSLYETASALRPAYIKQKNKGGEYKELPEDRLKRQIEKKKEEARLKELVYIKEKMELAEQLYEPMFEETPTGETKVTWTVFEKFGKKVMSGSRGDMLKNIYPIHIEGQFKGGTREEIIKLLKKQK